MIRDGGNELLGTQISNVFHSFPLIEYAFLSIDVTSDSIKVRKGHSAKY